MEFGAYGLSGSYDEEEVAMNNFLSVHSRAGSHKRAFTLASRAC